MERCAYIDGRFFRVRPVDFTVKQREQRFITARWEAHLASRSRNHHRVFAAFILVDDNVLELRCPIIDPLNQDSVVLKILNDQPLAA